MRVILCMFSRDDYEIMRSVVDEDEPEPEPELEDAVPVHTQLSLFFEAPPGHSPDDDKPSPFTEEPDGEDDA